MKQIPTWAESTLKAEKKWSDEEIQELRGMYMRKPVEQPKEEPKRKAGRPKKNG